ncbi:hypothetical protein Tsubulata_010578 [Turnera subulata]|uniref:Endonuclease/exonuclease/phosphatase domain-containing protein n=1 Tax=Turnera subulata TaxID=218843 RepID=A0A9Q0G953_9ROSI|nr:hypothetical protein Tsubulata_010578 [Turnera subulata]
MLDLKRVWKPNIAVVMEPRISGRKENRVVSRLGFSNSHRVDPRGFSGGIWILWEAQRMDVSIIYNHTQFIHLRVSMNNSSFLFTAVYGAPQDRWRKFLWENLISLAKDIKEPWLLGGDFNAILVGSERRTGRRQHRRANPPFQQCLLEASLLDMGFSGQQFTWKSGRKLARLDRFLCNSEWLQIFSEASITHLPRTSSDHCPVLCQLSPRQRRNAGLDNFKFQAAWLSHPEFDKFVEAAWQPSPHITHTIDNFVVQAGD